MYHCRQCSKTYESRKKGVPFESFNFAFKPTPPNWLMRQLGPNVEWLCSTECAKLYLEHECQEMQKSCKHERGVHWVRRDTDDIYACSECAMEGLYPYNPELRTNVFIPNKE